MPTGSSCLFCFHEKWLVVKPAALVEIDGRYIPTPHIMLSQGAPRETIWQQASRLMVTIAFTKIIQPKTSKRKLQVFKFQFQSNKMECHFQCHNIKSHENNTKDTACIKSYRHIFFHLLQSFSSHHF